MADLVNRHCAPCEGNTPALNSEGVAALHTSVPDWTVSADGKRITRSFVFGDYAQSLAFANAVAWVAVREDHHPEMVVNYSRVEVRYETHAIGGLSMNDFICAAKVDALLR